MLSIFFIIRSALFIRRSCSRCRLLFAIRTVCFCYIFCVQETIYGLCVLFVPQNISHIFLAHSTKLLHVVDSTGYLCHILSRYKRQMHKKVVGSRIVDLIAVQHIVCCDSHSFIHIWLRIAVLQIPEEIGCRVRTLTPENPQFVEM